MRPSQTKKQQIQNKANKFSEQWNSKFNDLQSNLASFQSLKQSLRNTITELKNDHDKNESQIGVISGNKENYNPNCNGDQRNIILTQHSNCVSEFDGNLRPSFNQLSNNKINKLITNKDQQLQTNNKIDSKGGKNLLQSNIITLQNDDTDDTYGAITQKELGKMETRIENKTDLQIVKKIDYKFEKQNQSQSMLQAQDFIFQNELHYDKQQPITNTLQNTMQNLSLQENKQSLSKNQQELEQSQLNKELKSEKYEFIYTDANKSCKGDIQLSKCERQEKGDNQLISNKRLNISQQTRYMSKNNNNKQLEKEANDDDFIIKQYFPSLQIDVNSIDTQTIGSWLRAIELEKYLQNFADNSIYDNKSLVEYFNKTDGWHRLLVSLFGIDKHGHRIRIIMRILQDSGIVFEDNYSEKEISKMEIKFRKVVKYQKTSLLKQCKNYMKLKKHEHLDSELDEDELTKQNVQILKKWLQSLNLEKYVSNFVNNGYEDFCWILNQQKNFIPFSTDYISKYILTSNDVEEKDLEAIYCSLLDLTDRINSVPSEFQTCKIMKPCASQQCTIF